MSVNPLLAVNALNVVFRTKSNTGLLATKRIHAVKNVSFNIHEGEVLSLVGESGCGKTTIGRVITRLETTGSGEINYAGQNILAMPASRFRPLRKHIQMIFQDPYASLNPRLTVEKTLSEPLFIHKLVKNRDEARTKITTMLKEVGLGAEAMDRYPHEFSGGQRQRIGIARAMLVSPRLIIADEAVSALDVSIQAQVLNLLKKLQRSSGVAMLFISHDLAVVRHISDRICVMYRGEIVEQNATQNIFEQPQHEYTQRLLSSIPVIPGRDKADSTVSDNRGTL
ncbi:MAG: ATP-binding cassette domain-containing protein [Granulosicoccus sp.]